MSASVVRGRGRSALIALVATALALTTAFGTAHAQDAPQTSPVGPNVNSFGFTVRPYSEPGSVPRDALEYQLPAGQGASDKISVANLTDAPKTFYLYASDAYNTSAGGLALHLRTDAAQDAGSWVKLPVQSYTIPAKSAALIPITITIPPDATPGDHTAGIVAEEQVAASTEAQTGGLQPIHRVGTRVYVRVQGDVTPQLQVTNISVSHHDPVVPVIGKGSASVTYTVTNTGNIRLKLDSTTVKINGPLGYTAKTFKTTNDPDGTLPDELLPGNSVVYTQSMGAIPPLFLMSATVSVKAEDPLQQGPVVASANVWFWVVPWLLLAVIVVLIAAFVGWRWWRRRHPASKADGIDPDGGEGTPDGGGSDGGGGDHAVEPQPATVTAGGEASAP